MDSDMETYSKDGVVYSVSRATVKRLVAKVEADRERLDVAGGTINRQADQIERLEAEVEMWRDRAYNCGYMGGD